MFFFEACTCKLVWILVLRVISERLSHQWLGIPGEAATGRNPKGAEVAQSLNSSEPKESIFFGGFDSHF